MKKINSDENHLNVVPALFKPAKQDKPGQTGPRMVCHFRAEVNFPFLPGGSGLGGWDFGGGLGGLGGTQMKRYFRRQQFCEEYNRSGLFRQCQRD